MSTIPRPEHPRPDMRRELWENLNGSWRFCFDERNIGETERWYQNGDFKKTITVPFCYQCGLSGIGENKHYDVVWYARNCVIPETFTGHRTLLHFGAVDHTAKVWLNGQYLGMHEGGYTPFSFDITDHVHPGERCLIVVRAEDELSFCRPRGKQSFRPEPFSCFYTESTGIWQPVWLEAVGEYHAQTVRLTPDIDNGCVHAEISLNAIPDSGRLRLTATLNGDHRAGVVEVSAAQKTVKASLYLAHDETLGGFRLWSPESPDLYDLTIELLSGQTVVDTLYTYFGMRKIAVERGRVALNNMPVYQRLILDQGYWPYGHLTAPSDAAIQRDIKLTLQMGYNGARKHQKIEDPRYLYWADKMGLLVWEELPSAYQFCQQEKQGLIQVLTEAVSRDYNHPSIIAWTPLNESWGVPCIQTHREQQQLADALYHLLKCLDGTRIVSGNDGWEQAATDILAVHDYTAWGSRLATAYENADTLREGTAVKRFLEAGSYNHAGKPVLITEYGGIALQKDAHNGAWGYNKAETTAEELLQRFADITAAFKKIPYITGYCYTQLTDVFQEVNGLLDMDRNPKVDLEAIRKINLA